MTAITGKGGNVEYGGGHVATINSWSLDVNTSMHDVTSFTTSAAKWRTFVDGLSGWTGSIDGIYDPTSTGQADLVAATLTPASATVVLELDQVAGGSLTGSIFLESMSLGVDIDSPVDASWSMQGTGALAFSTST